jgi:hypothetical protein
MSRNLDELVTTTEHAEPLHPVRALFHHHFFLDGLVNNDGGMWLVLTNALLLVPLMMAAFFYPVPVLIGTGSVLLVAFLAYEGYVFWRSRHVRA